MPESVLAGGQPSGPGETAGPGVSVIVPFFRSQETLAACIESILAQEEVRGGFELILIDNASPDDSPAIARRYAKAVLLEESRPGAYAARNTGLRQARGELIAFTDADCVVDPRWLRSLQEGMDDPGTGVLLGHCSYPAEASLPLRLLGAYENAKTDYVLRQCEPGHRFAYANNMATRASLFREIGLFEEWSRAADSEWVHRLAARRPELRVAFRGSMRVVHHEFLRARDRARRLSLYTETNSKIDSFQELGTRRRLAALLHGLRGWSAFR